MKENERDELLVRIDEKVTGINKRLDRLNGKTAEIDRLCGQNTEDIAVLKSQPSAWKALGIFASFVSLLYALDKFLL